VEYSKVKKEYVVREYGTESCGNLYALVMERSFSLVRRHGYLCLIVPISAVSTPRMEKLMSILATVPEHLHISNYAVRPSKLFVGVDMNLTILLARCGLGNDKHKTVSYATCYQRWYTDFRPLLFQLLSYQKCQYLSSHNAFPKISSCIESRVIDKVLTFESLSSILTAKHAGVIFYHSGGRYYRKCILDKLSNEYKPLRIPAGAETKVIALLSSNLYYLFWLVFSDTYHVTRPDIEHFNAPQTVLHDERLGSLGEDLLADLWKNATKRHRQRQGGAQQLEVNFNVGLSKPVIDEIDRVLAKHYGFTDEELDFIINYDIKYRMGRDALERD